MIRLVATVAVLATAGAATAVAAPTNAPAPTSSKAQRKDLPPGVGEAASEAFAKAREADEAGDLVKAADYYLTAQRIASHPNCVYNLADVYRRQKKLHEAIETYKHYLQLAPTAPDRVAVEKLIASLEATPGTLLIHETGPHEQAFVDGEPAGELPQTLELSAGWHYVDVITPISYGWMRCEVRMAQKSECHPSPAPRMDGNVVISGSDRVGLSNHWRETGAYFMMRERFELRHGHYTIEKAVYKQCGPFDIDVAPGDTSLTYVYLTAPDEKPKDHDECIPVTAKQRVLKLL